MGDCVGCVSLHLAMCEQDYDIKYDTEEGEEREIERERGGSRIG